MELALRPLSVYMSTRCVQPPTPVSFHPRDFLITGQSGILLMSSTPSCSFSWLSRSSFHALSFCLLWDPIGWLPVRRLNYSQQAVESDDLLMYFCLSWFLWANATCAVISHIGNSQVIRFTGVLFQVRKALMNLPVCYVFLDVFIWSQNVSSFFLVAAETVNHCQYDTTQRLKYVKQYSC